MSPEMIQALATATKQWHEAVRQYELMSRGFSDAQTQLQLAERDLHELARAIEIATGTPAAELVSNEAMEHGSVTMPVVPAGQVGADVDAAAIVLEQMRQQRLGNP